MLHELGSDLQPILLTIPLSPVFRYNKHPLFFNFQKACWNDFASYFDSDCLFAEEYSSLSLFSAAAIFTSLALNMAKVSIPFGRIKRHPKAWWSAEAEEVGSERRIAFTAAHRSDEVCQAYISASQHAASVFAKPKVRHSRQLAPFSRPNLILTLYIISFVLLLAHLSPLLTSPTVPLPRSRLWISPIT